MITSTEELSRLLAGEQTPELTSHLQETTALLGRHALAAARATTTLTELPADFDLRHAQGWDTVIANLATWQGVPAGETDLSFAAGRLVTGWLFPDAPRALSAALAANTVLLVSNAADWLAPFTSANLTVNIHDDGAASDLDERMARQQPVIAMLDNCYPATSSVEAPLLGWTVSVPDGVLQLAARHRYQLDFPVSVSGRVTAGATTDATDQTSAQLAAWFNTLLERQMLQTPEQWLSLPWLATRSRPPRSDTRANPNRGVRLPHSSQT